MLIAFCFVERASCVCGGRTLWSVPSGCGAGRGSAPLWASCFPHMLIRPLLLSVFSVTDSVVVSGIIVHASHLRQHGSNGSDLVCLVCRHPLPFSTPSFIL